jgi:hypothetical protein
MTTAYTVQKFVVGVVLLGTAALLAVWTVLLTDFDKLVAATPPSVAYRSTRNYVLVATLLLVNIGFLALLKVVTRSHATCGPIYTGLLASHSLLSAAFVHVAFMDAWTGDATYAPYYSHLAINLLSGLRLQLACLVLSWTTAGFVCAVCFDRNISADSNNYETSSRHTLRVRSGGDDSFAEEDGFSGHPAAAGAALRRRGRSPATLKRACALGHGPVTVDASMAGTTAPDGDMVGGAGQQHAASAWYLATPPDGPQFYVPAGPVFAPARRV